ncbi:MAG: serine/threonine-protein phosphatase [Acidimicrobiia bacterium]|nr:serine/threonine-protein phosphatase [Acidimicrobiia bacterium]MBV9041234.1 serine/threonine-protein phosphatase [Acidimicrobiia bacterium]
MSADLAEDAGNGVIAAHGVLAKLTWALRSEPGDVRPHNEDYTGAFAPTTPDDSWDRGPLVIVADGLGGHAAGEVASRVAVDAAIADWTRGSAQAARQALRNAVRTANVAVYDAALERGRQGMGTTMTALTLAGHAALIANVGDSRTYRVRGESCEQLTADHSKVAEMLRMRLITPEQAANHPARSMLTRSLGADPAVQVDIVETDVARDDVFVLCSDGLWDAVSRGEIATMVSAMVGERSIVSVDAAAALVDLALKRDAPDNVTAAVVHVTSDRPIPAAAGRRSLFRRR